VGPKEVSTKKSREQSCMRGGTDGCYGQYLLMTRAASAVEKRETEKSYRSCMLRCSAAPKGQR
jgi:hypothetical protein